MWVDERNVSQPFCRWTKKHITLGQKSISIICLDDVFKKKKGKVMQYERWGERVNYKLENMGGCKARSFTFCIIMQFFAKCHAFTYY